jgi:hypothetical protein
MVARITLPLAALLLAACGYRGGVSRIDMNRTDVPRSALKAEQKAEAERVSRQLQFQPQARPQRVDEALTKPGERPEDPFDRPPS